MRKVTWFILCALLLAACKKAYNPPVVNSGKTYLVVEGFVNTGRDSTIITLSRTVNLSAATTASPELNAQVTVEDNSNNSYPLTSAGNGRYTAAPLNTDNTRQYRVRIKTAGGQTYLSDFVAALAAPPIDSVGYTVQNNGVQVYANTHDATNATKYYRWEYGETWIFYAQWPSAYRIVNNLIVYITDGQDFQCWGHDTSSTITLGSTAHLSQAVINQAPLAFIPSTSEKLESRYSILVKEYGITPDAYNYFTLLKQNTEGLGTIFSPLPSGLTGNIHNTANAAEPVLGFIGAGTVTEKRIYIDKSTLPAWVPATYYEAYGCPQDTITASPAPSGWVPYIQTPVKTTYALYQCTDCTLRGSNKQPAFWKNN